MSETQTGSTIWEFVGGSLCLDFANTVNCYDCDEPADILTSYADLVNWGREAGTVGERGARRLLREAAGRPEEAAEVLGGAKAARLAFFRVVSAAVDGHSPDSSDLDVFNTALARALARSRIAPDGARFTWDWEKDAGALDRIVWPIMRSAAMLLTSEDLARVRRCGGDMCTWLFLDSSKNKSRRWCEMKGCGNRAKSRRHYQRTRSASGLRPGA